MLRSDQCLFSNIKLVLGKPSIYVGEVVSPPTLTYIKINSTRSAIIIIDICIDNRPLKFLYIERKKGLEISNVVILERPKDWEDVAYEHGANEVAMK